MVAKRNRGKFDPENPNPYELSRSRVENFLKCKACFWLEQLHKVKPTVSLAAFRATSTNGRKLAEPLVSNLTRQCVLHYLRRAG